MTRNTVLSLFPDMVPPKFAGPLPMSVQHGNNADIVRSLADVYFGDDRRVVDLTYGAAGGWWKLHRPARLVVSSHDFTDLPYATGEFDAVCYDPPYIPQGGVGDPSVSAFGDRFGLEQRNETDLMAVILAGATEAARITSPSTGFLCVKCMDFTNGGKFKAWSYAIYRHLTETVGMYLHDEIIHAAGTGPGGHNIETPRRARRSHSKLLIFTWSAR